MTEDALASPPPAGEKTSATLRRVLQKLKGEEVRIGMVLYQLRRRSFGGVFMILAALSLLPGIAIFAGIMMSIPALQLAAGLRSPLLPRFLRERRVTVGKLRAVAYKAIPWIEKIERFVKPRWPLLTTVAMGVPLGILITGLGLMVAIPLPFTNFLPAIAVFFIALGLLERDGVLIFIGLLTAIFALLIGFLIIFVVIESFPGLLAA